MEDAILNARARLVEDVIHIKRTLLGKQGKIFVVLGQEVQPHDILGESETSAGFMTVNLAKELEVTTDTADKFLKRKIGQKIFKGELIAEKVSRWGFRKNIVLSPVDGILEFYDRGSGVLKIKLSSTKHRLVSGVYGIVDALKIATGEIMVRTFASIIYGLFGSGMERSGTLKIIGSPNMLVSSRQIKEHLSGDIVVGGGMVFLDALQKAMQLKVSGIVSGGLNAADFRSMRGGGLDFDKKRLSDVGISVMATEGFGSISIGEDIFSKLKQHDGHFAIVNGNGCYLILPTSSSDSMIGIRKKVMPLNVDISPKESQIVPKLGDKVRIVSSFLYMGTQGKIVFIDKTETKLPSGVRTYLMTVESSKLKLKVPYQNLEVISVA